MSLHRGFYGSDPNFSSLFRFLDDFDNYSREVNQDNGRRHASAGARTFNPRFDVRETEAAYELHGELPGIDREHVNIEFTDPQTIVIRGRVERNYASGIPPADVTEKSEDHTSHKATVEDESVARAKELGSDTQVSKRSEGHVDKHKNHEKFWVSERSIGEFSRTFSFPGRIDQDAVSANLNNGILSIVVPKAKKAETRRITIN